MALVDRLSLAWARYRHPFGAFVSWLAVAIGIIGGGSTIILALTESDTIKEWVLSGALSTIAVVALVTLGCREMQLSQQSRFARTLRQQHLASELLRDLRVFLRSNVVQAQGGAEIDPATAARARKLVQDVLSEFSDIYSIWTSTRCRMCVKLIEVSPAEGATHVSPEDVSIFTLARDKHSAHEQLRHDMRRAKENLDKLNGNSDFLRLWDQGVDDEGYFFSKDLDKEAEYDTSSLNYWRNIAGNPNRNVKDEWPLWYRSTIVWPIRQEVREELGITQESCIGFLAVDSRIPGAFDADDHPLLGKLLANSLYPILDLYTRLTGVIPEAPNGRDHETG